MRKSKNFAGNSDCDTINVSPNPSSLKIAWVKSSLFSGGEVVKVQQKMKCTRWNMCQELFSTKASFTFRGFDRLIGPKPMGLSNWNTEHFFLKFLNGELDLLVTLSRETLLPKIGHLRELCEGRRAFCPAQQYQRSFSTQIPLDNWTLGQLKGGTILTSFQIGFDREYSIYGKSWFWSLEKVVGFAQLLFSCLFSNWSCLGDKMSGKQSWLGYVKRGDANLSRLWIMWGQVDQTSLEIARFARQLKLSSW